MNETENLELLGDGVLSGITRLIIETEEESPVPIAVITALEIQTAKGYRVRLKPRY